MYFFISIELLDSFVVNERKIDIKKEEICSASRALTARTPPMVFSVFRGSASGALCSSVPSRFSSPNARKARSARPLGATPGNTNFDPSDPLTWNEPAGNDDDSVFMQASDIVANVEDVQMLSDADLAKIVGMEGASVPQMVGDRINEGKSLDFEEEDTVNRAVSTTAEGIKEGMELYKQKEFQEAEATFRAALTLPGTGPVRFRKGKVAPAGPSAGFQERESSQAEIFAVHYNRACCFAQMGEVDDGLECLNLAIENGFDDFKYLRSDADVAALRKDSRFEKMMDKYEPKGVVGALNELMNGNGGMENPGGVVGMFMDKMKEMRK